jgi:hypothetical protein
VTLTARSLGWPGALDNGRAIGLTATSRGMMGEMLAWSDEF